MLPRPRLEPRPMPFDDGGIFDMLLGLRPGSFLITGLTSCSRSGIAGLTSSPELSSSTRIPYLDGVVVVDPDSLTDFAAERGVVVDDAPVLLRGVETTDLTAIPVRLPFLRAWSRILTRCSVIARAVGLSPGD